MLSPRHHEAIDLILQGRTDTEIAARFGVARETVNRWRNEYPPFIAELNQRRQNVWNATRERLRGLGAKALDVLDQQVQAGNVKVALALLKQVQEERVPHGATDIEEVIDEIVQRLDLAALVRRLGPVEDNPIRQRMRAIWLPPSHTPAVETPPELTPPVGG